MADVQITTTVDTSVLNAAIPQIVAFGRRTMHEQCVTSAAFICLDAQANTPAVTVGRIDAELEVEVRGYTAKGRPSRAKNPKERRVTSKPGVRIPMAVLIVMARTNPDSSYSKLTGNRWPLSLSALPTGPGSGPARQAIIARWVSRMTLSRHSSTHFLQHGWGPAIRTLLSDPAYYAGRSRFRISAQTKINSLNLLDTGPLGSALIELTGDQCFVMAENAIGGEGNAVLAAKHNAAAIAHALPPTRRAVQKEAATIFRKVQDNLDKGMRQDFSNL